MEFDSSQTNQLSSSAVLGSKGMEIVLVNEEISRPFEVYLEQEVFHVHPEAQPNNFILASTMNETNDGQR
jgi:hypothetical protein